MFFSLAFALAAGKINSAVFALEFLTCLGSPIWFTATNG